MREREERDRDRFQIPCIPRKARKGSKKRLNINKEFPVKNKSALVVFITIKAVISILEVLSVAGIIRQRFRQCLYLAMNLILSRSKGLYNYY